MSVDLITQGAVAKIVLNRPEKLNALTREMRVQLRAHFERLRFDEAVRAILVTGEGRAFCTGADVTGMQRGGLREERERIMGGSHMFLRVMHAIEKPIIAAVRGPSVGIGWSIALACDLIVASETARFSQIFRRIGLAPDGGAIWLLTRRIGMARAKELVFTARFVEAQEALALGLVNEVVPDDQLLARAEELAADLATGPTFAFGLAKKLFHMASSPSYEDFLDMEAFVQPQLDQTEDHREGVAAFKEKRRPNFVGR
jgi:2-(1,2-epoxy-1,2-dihydrophenyl)acetyl-CoA isomerase